MGKEMEGQALEGGPLGVHDVGGLKDNRALDFTEPAVAYWERQTHALVGIVSSKGLLTVDELRRGVEGLPPAAYESLPYYEKWARSLAVTLLDRGVMTTQDLDSVLGPEKETDIGVK
jgi:hypothetical protein